jgi:hypothetical protein
VRGQELHECGAGDAVGGVVENAIHSRQQFQTIDSPRARSLRIRRRERVQPNGRQLFAAAMNRDFHSVGIGLEGDVYAVAALADLRDRFAANVAGSAGKLSTILGLKPRMNGLVFHSATEYANQVPALVDVKHYAHWLISHDEWASDSATLISQASLQSGQ